MFAAYACLIAMQYFRNSGLQSFVFLPTPVYPTQATIAFGLPMPPTKTAIAMEYPMVVICALAAMLHAISITMVCAHPFVQKRKQMPVMHTTIQTCTKQRTACHDVLICKIQSGA